MTRSWSGGGHNGLVAAAYLAAPVPAPSCSSHGHDRRRGHDREPVAGRTAPSVTRLSYVMSLMPPTIVDDLQLERHGYKVHPMGPYYQAFPEGGSLTIYEDDPARTYDEIAQWSKKDADALAEVERLAGGLADVLGPLLTQVPPTIGSHRPADLLDAARLAWSAARASTCGRVADVTRLMTMSIADLLDDWFESPQVKGALAVNGVIGTWAGPYEPGTAYVMAHHSIGDVGDGQLGSWGYPEGGMGAVSAAIASVGASSSAPRSAPTRGSTGCIVRDGRVAGRRARRRARSSARRSSSRPCTRRSRSSTRSRAASCPRTSSPTSSGGRPAAAS